LKLEVLWGGNGEAMEEQPRCDEGNKV
jgi:hypothetical protein